MNKSGNPSIVRSHFTLADGPASTAAGSPDEIAKLFPHLYGQPSASVVPSAEPVTTKPLKIGVVLSGGHAPGSNNVICGIFNSRLPARACKGQHHVRFQGRPSWGHEGQVRRAHC